MSMKCWSVFIEMEDRWVSVGNILAFDEIDAIQHYRSTHNEFLNLISGNHADTMNIEVVCVEPLR